MCRLLLRHFTLFMLKQNLFYCAVKQWNSLLSHICHIQYSHAFKTVLKTHLYQTIPHLIQILPFVCFFLSEVCIVMCTSLSLNLSFMSLLPLKHTTLNLPMCICVCVQMEMSIYMCVIISYLLQQWNCFDI